MLFYFRKFIFKCPQGKKDFIFLFAATASLSLYSMLQFKMILQAISFLVIVLADISAAGKDCKYAKFTPQHTFCIVRNSSCKILHEGLNNKEKELILKIHNDYRSKIALGKESRAGGMPEAANMLEMEWDDELEAIAQKWSYQCGFEVAHDCSDCRRVDRFSVGQNVYTCSQSHKKPTEETIQKGLKAFYEEVSLYHKDKVPSYESSKTSEKWGHFTQMVWAESYKIGCGFTEFKEEGKFNYQHKLVCNYGPAGNYISEPVYKEGKPASSCPKAKSKIPGLCKNTSS